MESSLELSTMDILCINNGKALFNEKLLRYIGLGYNKEVLNTLQNINPCWQTDSSGMTLLHFATKFGNVWFTKYLIDLGATVDALNHLKETPLMLAVENNQVEAVKVLLEADADIFIPDVHGECAFKKGFNNMREMNNFLRKNLDSRLEKKYFDLLHIADDIVTALRGRVTTKILNKSKFVKNKAFHSACPLYYFIPIENVEVTRILLENGSQVDEIDPATGRTSLHQAVRKMDLENVKLLLQWNANVNAKNFNGNTPLSSILGIKDPIRTLAIINVLLDSGATLIDKTTNRILVEALLSQGNREIVRTILSKIDLDFQDIYGYTPIYYLAINQNPTVIEELRHLKFNINVRCNSRRTFLHYAAAFQNVAFIRFLIEHGADVNAVDRRFNMPLKIAMSYGKYRSSSKALESVEILLEHGANPQICKEREYLWPEIFYKSPLSDDVIKIIRPVLDSLAFIEVTDQVIEPVVRRRIESCPQLFSSFHSSKLQLEEMKQIVIYKSITLFDFLIASDKKISIYARNNTLFSNLAKIMGNCNTDSRYRRKLCQLFLKFTRLIELRKKVATTLTEILEEVWNISVYNIAEKVVNYLQDEELYKIV